MGTEAFELPIQIQPEDIDYLGHVNNVTYVRWVQDVAVAHWRALATPEEQERFVWVVLRHEIDYKLAAMRQDGITARTWVGTATRIRFERHTQILRAQDRVLLAQALTVWCPIDTRTRKPSAVTPEIRTKFSGFVP